MLSDMMLHGAAMVALASPTERASLPRNLHGHWTDDLSNCSKEDTGGMLVRAQSIQFYEASGTPKSIRRKSNGAVAAEVTYEGEGKNWTEINEYMVSSDRTTIRVDALGRTFTLKRCAGG